MLNINILTTLFIAIGLSNYVWAGEGLDNTDSARKPLAYKCAKGNKTFETKIVVEDGGGETSIVGDIEIGMDSGSKKVIPLNLRVFFGPVVVGEGDSSASISSVN